jgi:hypothetical protein
MTKMDTLRNQQLPEQNIVLGAPSADATYVNAQGLLHRGNEPR